MYFPLDWWPDSCAATLLDISSLSRTLGRAVWIYLGTIRLDSSLVTLFIGLKNVLGFRFVLYMSPSFGGSWMILTLCISSHVMVWFCHSIVFCALVTQVCLVCTPLGSSHSYIEWLLLMLVLCLYLYPLLCLYKRGFAACLKYVFAAWCQVSAVGCGRTCKAFGEALERLEVGWESRMFMS